MNTTLSPNCPKTSRIRRYGANYTFILQNVNCISDESDNSDRSTDNVARKYGLDTSLYDKTHLSKSSEAVNQAWKSMENFAGDIAFVDLPNGVVHFFASYNKHSRK